MLSLGPLRYAIDADHLPIEMLAFCADGSGPEARRVSVHDPSERTGDATPTWRAAIARRAFGDLIFARRDGSMLDVMDALCALVALDAPRHGCVLLHASAISTARGVALFTAPPGTGKSTAARHAGQRAFAYNSVLLRTDGLCWPMPFAGPSGDPRLSALGPRMAGVLVELLRSDVPKIEYLGGARASIVLARAYVRPVGSDPLRFARAESILQVTERLISLRLGVTNDPRYLTTLDTALDETLNDYYP